MAQKRIENDEFKSNDIYHHRMAPVHKEHNFFIDENDRSSSLNVSLHIQSSNSNGLQSESKIVEENLKPDDATNKYDEQLKKDNQSGLRVFKHPPLKNTRSLPTWNRSLTSNVFNNQTPGLSKGFKTEC